MTKMKMKKRHWRVDTVKMKIEKEELALVCSLPEILIAFSILSEL